MDENTVRAAWKTGAVCQIYSNSKKRWFSGEVAQIFTDEEGEWLEVRYDKSMSKQVQRFSSDIRPHPDDLKKKKKQKKTDNVPFPDQEMRSSKKKENLLEKEKQMRQSWDKGDEVEIFSNTHQEWYLGEIVDIIKDDEGEWLNCVWARANGEAMSKQVQRFSTDVRPVQDDNSSSGSSSDERPSPKQQASSAPPTQAEKIQQLSVKIQQRKNNFRRRAPPFSRTLRPSTFTYPASNAARRARKLLDLEETIEKNQFVAERAPVPLTGSKDKKRLDIEVMKPEQVCEFIGSMGKAYVKYVSKFREISGRELVKFTEASLTKFVQPKLHRTKILLEISRNLPNKEHADLFDHDIEVLKWGPLKVKEWCTKTQFMNVYAQKFLNHGIDGMLLFELDSKDLATIGVKKMHQNRVLEIISKFAKSQFPTSPKDDEKEQEAENANGTLALSDISSNDSQGRAKRGSVANIDTSQLQYNGGSTMNGGDAKGGIGGNNDAIIFTMGALLLELGQMFKNAKVQALTATLQQQLNELQSTSKHVPPNRIAMLSVDTTATATPAPTPKEFEAAKDDQALIAKMQDRVDTSPTGVDAAWLKTQAQAKGHKRRSSLPFLNANQLEEEEEDDISDIE
mmetsp:Transcript_10328/g.16661  ORF Transcript_10328/g.16661 Transcript_10328/m.16661 type:complete len:623 (+) Transcript_10328:199-2067(+)|eukprot:CAMPEP_0197022002 /NCGR_PEP_ID=MMETSP1384-20130603/2906_1 /TAXON_ID=29189 /ORGANISM="Ammonia sp." /LENGTH=622 /DNA_ID=CAMNT_0042449957 /DNA_START=192 /DNA_END=2060 /DNA_ORIENTATION=+